MIRNLAAAVGLAAAARRGNRRARAILSIGADQPRDPARGGGRDRHFRARDHRRAFARAQGRDRPGEPPRRGGRSRHRARGQGAEGRPHHPAHEQRGAGVPHGARSEDRDLRSVPRSHAARPGDAQPQRPRFQRRAAVPQLQGNDRVREEGTAQHRHRGRRLGGALLHQDHFGADQDRAHHGALHRSDSGGHRGARQSCRRGDPRAGHHDRALEERRGARHRDLEQGRASSPRSRRSPSSATPSRCSASGPRSSRPRACRPRSSTRWCPRSSARSPPPASRRASSPSASCPSMLRRRSSSTKCARSISACRSSPARRAW